MYKVTIDPGHDHQSNVSPTVKNYTEGVQMYKLAGYLALALKEYDIESEITRKSLKDCPTLEDRGKLAGKNGSNLFVSLHSNAPGKKKDGTYDTSITGTCVYYSLTDEDNKDLADELGNVISAKMGHNYRGSKTKEYSEEHPDWDYYGVIRNAARSGCKAAYLIEHGFHTCPKDAAYLMSDSNLRQLAQAEAKVIAEYFGAGKTLYRVQIGAFSNRQNAEAYKKKAEADGYQAFVVEA
ncbi:MAG: N-acetylmuramoyl-L-alanine amidase [Oscillospiraceae bacterium]|nr:N-acetylmuramoyl-L-alanine amidase [Oscillospiraceae bacterium]